MLCRYCSPTRSSFLSARFPLHVNELNGGSCDGGGIDLRMKLLPQKLATARYRSYMVGKGHIGSRSLANLPINRGFDHHLGFLGGGEDHWTQSNGDVVDLWLDDAPAWGLNGTGYSCDMYSGKAVSLIEEHATRYPSQGMFLYLPFHVVHEPYEAEDRFIDPSILDKGRQTMAAMVSCVSEGTGNVSRALRRAGMWDSTLFLWSSDNGGPQYWLGNNCAFGLNAYSPVVCDYLHPDRYPLLSLSDTRRVDGRLQTRCVEARALTSRVALLQPRSSQVVHFHRTCGARPPTHRCTWLTYISQSVCSLASPTRPAATMPSQAFHLSMESTFVLLFRR